MRAELNPMLLNKLGVSLDTVRTALGNRQMPTGPKGEFDRSDQCLDDRRQRSDSSQPTSTAADRCLQAKRRAGAPGGCRQTCRIRSKTSAMSACPNGKPCGPAGHFPAARREHHRDRGQRPRAASPAAGLDFAGDQRSTS